MANAIFYQNARNIAYAADFPYNWDEKMNTENHIVLQTILDNLTSFILNGWFWKLKVLYASERAQQMTSIYQYFRYDMFQGYPVNNLINGPTYDPTWFSKNGYNSVMDQLSVALAPGKVQNNFFLKPKGSYITLNWYP
jgi:hypothetical protein